MSHLHMLKVIVHSKMMSFTCCHIIPNPIKLFCNKENLVKKKKMGYSVISNFTNTPHRMRTKLELSWMMTL